MRVLLIEDDELLGDGIRQGLIQEGYAVDWIKDGLHAEQVLEAQAKNLEKFDLIVLDLGLPRVPGLTVLKNARKRGDSTKVLILTARDTPEERIRGLDAGADDYMVKPFDLGELFARLRALHRRSGGRSEPAMQHDGLYINPASHLATLHGKPLNLSPKEFALLEKLLENAGRVLSREQLAQSLYGWDEEVDSNTVEVHIHNLRKKVGNDLIRTVRGVGYIIDKTP